MLRRQYHVAYSATTAHWRLEFDTSIFMLPCINVFIWFESSWQNRHQLDSCFYQLELNEHINKGTGTFLVFWSCIEIGQFTLIENGVLVICP